MSCTQNGGKVSKVCAVRNSVSAAGSQAAGVTGGMVTGLDQLNDRLGRAAAPAARLVLGQQSLLNARQQRGLQPARTLAVAAVGYTAGRGAAPLVRQIFQAQNADRLVRLACRLVPHGAALYTGLKAANRLSGLAGTAAANLTATGEAGQATVARRRLLLFKSTIRVDFWQSGLTGLLNRQDQLTGKLLSSQGAMFSIDGKTTWHQGVSVVKTSAGEQTITHLRSLSLLGQHYYFNRPLSAEEAAGVAAGQLKPETVPGFTGQVSPAESLAPSWASVKHSLIRASLHWPQEK